MAVNGKQKGNKFERDVANLFSKQFESYLGIKQGFTRNRDSGSFWGGQNKNRKHTHDTDYAIYGDLVCPKQFRFCVECKHYKKPPSLDSILNQNVKEWDKWIEQASQDAEESNKEMLLIIKYNSTKIFCIVDNCLTSDGSSVIIGNYKNYSILTLDEFLNKRDEYFFDE